MPQIENFKTGSTHDPVNSFVGRIDAPDEPQVKESQLDSQALRDRHKMLWDFFVQELARQADNRFQMACDADYYDHMQWSQEDAKELDERGQVPRVYNKIKPAIDWILGTEKRTRVDWKILARRKDGEKAAQSKTELMKYLADANRQQYLRSRAFADAVKVGVGWLEEGMFDADDGEPLYLGWESWRNVLWDSVNPHHDVSEGRYVFRVKWVDVDVACTWFPDRKELIEQSALDGYNYTNAEEDSDEAMEAVEAASHDYAVAGTVSMFKRRRVRLIEAWYKVPERVKVIKAAQEHPLKGDMYDPNDQAHIDAEQSGLVSIAERVKMVTRLAIMCKGGMLYDAKSPYKHNKFPFTAVWGYRRDRDNLPYGTVRGLRDPQDDLNKRISKSLAILSTNKTIMDRGAVDDLEEFAKEVARPDAIIVKNKGKDLEINVDRDLAPAHLEFAHMDMKMIQDASGVTDENMGRETNATSGKAIIARQDQGAMATAELFDNLRLASQISGEKTLALSEQFYRDEKIIRILGNKGQVEFKMINDPNLPQSWIAAHKADFIVSEQDFRDSMRIAAQEQLAEMVSSMPEQIGLALLDVVVDMMDLGPQKDELLKRIRKINGQVDPDQEMTPEEQQAQQAAAEQAQAQQELAQRGMAAEVALKEAQVDKTRAETEQIGANIQAQSMQADPHAQMQMQMQADMQKHGMTLEQQHRNALIQAHTAIEKARMDAKQRARAAEIATLSKATAAEQAEQQQGATTA
jgi:hypothetical protein